MPYPGPGVFPGPDLYPGEGEVEEGPRTLQAAVSFNADGLVSTVGTPVDVLVPTSTATTIRVRNLPPLRMHLELVTPSGRSFRWGEDEASPENIPTGLRHSSTMPGGYESLDVTLPRKPGVDYSDLERFSTINVWSAGGKKVGEYRLERIPQVSGDQMSVSPSAVGWQAHLEDDKNASVVFIDRDLSSFYSNPRPRVLTHLAISMDMHDSSTTQDTTNGLPAVRTSIRGAWSRPTLSEAWYDAGGPNKIARVRGTMTLTSQVGAGVDANWNIRVYTSADDAASAIETPGDMDATAAFDHITATPRRFMFFQQYYAAGPAGGDGQEYPVFWTDIRIIGDHGLTLQAASGPTTEGFLASDIASYAVGRWAQKLHYDSSTVIPGGYVVPQAAHKDATTAGEMVRQAARFGLEDWAVWDDLTFYWAPRNYFGKSWRARVAPAQLEETGPQADRLWNGVVVQYQDVTGVARTVGPPGSGANVESATLSDADPDNPATLLGIERVERLQMGVSTSAGAIEVGRRFLIESKLLDRSGRARLVGHVMDDRGVMHPYSDVRAGDSISFLDASDTSLRRIVKADHDRASRTCSVDLDAPPEGLQALLERLGVGLASQGFN